MLLRMIEGRDLPRAGDGRGQSSGTRAEVRVTRDGVDHVLDGAPLHDGDHLELLTADGWVSGHYRSLLHPETGELRFDLHLRVPGAGDGTLHVGLWLPASAVLRRRP